MHQNAATPRQMCDDSPRITVTLVLGGVQLLDALASIFPLRAQLSR